MSEEEKEMQENGEPKKSKTKERVMIAVSIVVILFAVSSIVFYGGIDLGFGKTVIEDLETEKYEYDDNGNLLRHEIYSDGELLYYFRYEYDSAGNRTYKGSFQNGDIQLSEAWYDAEGAEIQTKEYENGILSNQITTEYTETGHTYVSERYDDLGALSIRSTYNYNSEGTIISSEYYSPMLELWDKSEFDENENVISIHCFNMDGSLKQLITSETDADGFNTQTDTEYDPDGKETSRSIQIYDNNDYLRESYSYEDGVLHRRRILEYDSQGKLTWEEYYSLDYSWYITEYNNYEDPVTTTYYEMDGSVKEVYEYFYVYADNGMMLSEEEYRNGELYYSDEYLYDSDWNLILDKHYLRSELYHVYEYYPNGKIKKYEWYSSGNLYMATYYEYDDEWNQTLVEEYVAEGIINNRWEYDSLERKTLYLKYYSGKLYSETLYEYFSEDEFSNIKLETVRYYDDGELDYYTVTTYNENRDIRYTIYYNADGTAR